jgi:hypothetical protein
VRFGSSIAFVVPGADTVFDAAVRDATLTFVGEVVARDTSAMPAIVSGAASTIVRVTQVVRAAAEFGNLAGSLVTVLAQDTTGLVVGGRAVFLTVGLAAGASIAVEERARVPVTTVADVDTVRMMLAQSDSVNRDREIVAQLLDADIVMLGVVVDTAILADTAAPRYQNARVQWRIAFEISRTFRRRDSTIAPVLGRIDVLAGEGDGETAGAASRLRLGDRRIVFAHRVVLLTPLGLGVPARYLVLEPADVRAAADTTRVIRLLATFPP